MKFRGGVGSGSGSGSGWVLYRGRLGSGFPGAGSGFRAMFMMGQDYRLRSSSSTGLLRPWSPEPQMSYRCRAS